MYILFLGFSQTQASNSLTPILTVLITAFVAYNLYCMKRQDDAIAELRKETQTNFVSVNGKLDSVSNNVSEIKGFLMGYGKLKPEPISDTEKETQKAA
jgi:hypothetical protein